jgi:hypothetical protein
MGEPVEDGSVHDAVFALEDREFVAEHRDHTLALQEPGACRAVLDVDHQPFACGHNNQHDQAVNQANRTPPDRSVH